METLDNGNMSSMIDVQLTTVDDIKAFVATAEEVPTLVLLRSGTYTIDAKSIFGVLSLSWDKPVKLEVAEKYVGCFGKWRV